MGDLSKNFSSWEFLCSCGCGHAETKQELVDCLQKLRDMLGARITITSGYRCKKKNATLVKTHGASKLSNHMIGLAADVFVQGVHPFDVALVACRIKEFACGGIGLYPRWIDEGGNPRGFVTHLDIGYFARWARMGVQKISWADAILRERRPC